MMVMSRFADSEAPPARDQAPPASPLQRSQSGGALSSLLHHQVYTPGQHSERSTTFLHKQRRGSAPRQSDSLALANSRNKSANSPASAPVTPTLPPVAANGPASVPPNVTAPVPTSAPAQALAGLAISAIDPKLASALESVPRSVAAAVAAVVADASESTTSVESDTTVKGASSMTSSDSDSSTRTMLRKKSGELVKSSLKLPSLLRTQSMPSKMVHFASNLEHVRRFSRREKPAAVSTNSTPVKERVSFQWASDSSDSHSDDAIDMDSADEESEAESSARNYKRKGLQWKISTPNFSIKDVERAESAGQMVFLDSVFLSTDKNFLIGHVCVKNTSFQKAVAIRYTVDFWKSVTEVVADYNGDVRRRTQQRGYDRFTFSVNISEIPIQVLSSKSMFFCIRYTCETGEFWDNNNSLNYEVLFTRAPPTEEPVQAQPKAVGRPARQSNLAQHRHPKAHHRRTKTEPNPDYIYDNDFDQLHAQVDSTTDLFDTAAYAPKPASPTKKANGLTSRYNFGASLNAALSRSSHTRSAVYDGEAEADADAEVTTTSESNSDDDDTTVVAGKPKSEPQLRSFIFPKSKGAAAGVGRPAWDSVSYQDIISKYCFFQDAPKAPGLGPVPLAATTAAATAAGYPKHLPTWPGDEALAVLSPSSSSPALVPQSTAAAAAAATALRNSSEPGATFGLDSSSSGSTTPTRSKSPTPTPSPASSDTLLDGPADPKMWPQLKV